MEEIIAGEIKGCREVKDFINDYMISMVNTIKDGKNIIIFFIELAQKFPTKKNEYYSYIKYNEIEREIKIFFKFYPNTKLNKREKEIYFIIIINEEYPQKAPIVQCIYDVNKKLHFTFQESFPNLSDCRNFQTILIPEWKQNNSFCELIQKIPDFINNIEEESKSNLLSIYGTYSLTYKYNINDFLSNSQNKVFKIKILSETNNKNLGNKYLIITDLFIIILDVANEKYKNECRIDFYNELIEIMNIKEFHIKKEENIYLDAIKFDWKRKSKKTFNDNILINPKEKGDIIELINMKQALLMSKYKKFLCRNENDLKVLTSIIDIKEKIFDKYQNDFTYRTITSLYQKVIDMSQKNYKQLNYYIEKLDKLMNKYDLLKKGK